MAACLGSLAAGSLRGLESEIIVFQEIIHKFSIKATSLPHGIIFVILLLTVRVMADCRIDKDIAWAGVEITAGVNTTLAVWWDKANLGNPTNVLACSKLSTVEENEGVEERYEKSTLPS